MKTQLEERPLPRADARHTVPPRPRLQPVGHDAWDRLPPSQAARRVRVRLLWWTTFAVFAAWLAGACYALVYLVSR